MHRQEEAHKYVFVQCTLQRLKFQVFRFERLLFQHLRLLKCLLLVQVPPALVLLMEYKALLPLVFSVAVVTHVPGTRTFSSGFPPRVCSAFAKTSRATGWHDSHTTCKYGLS